MAVGRAGDVNRVNARIFRQRVQVGVDRRRAVRLRELQRFRPVAGIDRRIGQAAAPCGGLQKPAGHEIRSDRRKADHRSLL
ncbi:hypothetical protein SDC9_203971 [bioreactor metagenome]|uniref:Uncharacterized protein n=1 Tax=bioreactor metagenome TaxID=1076179 RepID=A0A645IXW8_9ZZZZ